MDEQSDEQFLRELLEDAQGSPFSDAEWQMMIIEHSLSELADMVIDADYDGAFSGEAAVSGLQEETKERIGRIM